MKVKVDNDPRVLLFDIDGTLIVSGGAGMNAIKRALSQRYGTPGALDSIRPHGKTDPLIFREALANVGVRGAQMEQELMEVFRLYQRFLPQELQRARTGRICPGVLPLLEHLADTGGVYLGLLTGNFEPTAHIKLAHFGLDRFFRFGAFGSDEGERDLLVPIAVARAETLAGRPIGVGSQVLVIGDTPLDIRCAQANGATAVGVATSIFSPDELKAAGADLVFDDLSDTETVLEKLVTA